MYDHLEKEYKKNALAIQQLGMVVEQILNEIDTIKRSMAQVKTNTIKNKADINRIFDATEENKKADEAAKLMTHDRLADLLNDEYEAQKPKPNNVIDFPQINVRV